MPTIANWNGHTFEISPQLVRSFTDLSIKGACETTEKNTAHQKYVEHKYGEAAQLSLTVPLSVLTGVTDVYGESMEYVQEATDGASAYFYMGSEKLIPAKLMLISAQVVEVELMPGRGDVWVSANVKLTFKQSSKNDGTTGGDTGTGGTGGDGGSSIFERIKKGIEEGGEKVISTVSKLVDIAKQAAQQSKTAEDQKPGIGRLGEKILGQAKEVQTQADTSQKTSPTTSRKCDITVEKITLVPSALKKLGIAQIQKSQ